MSRLILSEIWIYPIKSLAGIRVKQAKVKTKGLELDRRWMLIDDSGRFLTQREHPEMALFKVSLESGSIRVSKGAESILIDTTPTNIGKVISAQIWEDEVEVVEVNQDYSNWFSSTLGMKCFLVYFPENNKRAVDPDYAINSEQVSLADGYPFLIIGQSSLDDLNSRLNKPVPMNRFRPNFVFTGAEAFAEDTWRNFMIGSNRFVGVKPCSRCVLTTVDQQTAEKSNEPLATLSAYRKKGNKINFGQNILAIDHYEIKEGDEIIVD